MSSHLAKTPLKLVQRSLATQAAAAAKAPTVPDAQVNTLQNGLTVASVDCDTPVATVAVMIKAGSRYESYAQRGSAQALQIMAGLSGKNYSSTAIIRSLQQLGSDLNCEYNRETLIYSFSALSGKVDEGIDWLVEAVCNQALKPWELSDSAYRFDEARSSQLGCQKTEDLLHQAAYRNGLGNAILAPAYMHGKYKPAMLAEYMNQNYTNERAAIVGFGVDSKKLNQYAELLSLGKGAGDQTKAKYYGGEMRMDGPGKKTYVCLAGETAGSNNVKEAVAAHALRLILGGSRMPYSAGAGKIAQAVAGMDGVTAYGCGKDYSDSALTGASIQADAAQAGKAVAAVAAALRSLTVTDKEVAGAKATLTAMAMERVESRDSIADVGFMALYNNKNIVPASKMAELINGITLGDVQAAAKKLSSGKLSMAASGNLSQVPYLDSL